MAIEVQKELHGIGVVNFDSVVQEREDEVAAIWGELCRSDLVLRFKLLAF